jgi:hypothetical protein
VLLLARPPAFTMPAQYDANIECNLQVESQPGLVALPIEQLQSSASSESRAANTSGWSAKMREAFQDLASRANHAVGAATESVSKAAKAAGTVLARLQLHASSVHDMFVVCGACAECTLPCWHVKKCHGDSRPHTCLLCSLTGKWSGAQSDRNVAP